MLLKVGVYMMVFALALTALAVAYTVAFREAPERAVASESSGATETTVEPLVRSKPTVEPWVEETQEPAPEPQPEPEPAPRPEPPPASPANEAADWPTPTPEQVEAASEPRHYELPPGAVMGLTVNALGIHNAPVFDSDGAWALNNGVSHEPGTSMPWSRSEQRNVYLQGHRLGWPGTGSHLVFYHLDRLERGDLVTLKDRDGERYAYRVTETFVVEPNDSWVMGRVRGRDMVTLQTCTPIPTFDKRLVVRADRV